MQKNRFLTRFVPSVLAVAVAAGGSLLLGGVANAAPPAGTLGTLTFDPPTGTNLTVGNALTSGPCNTGGDSALLDVVGPADSQFPPGNPYNITTTESTDYSQTDPFTVPFGVSLQTAATDRGKPLTAGEYDFTVHCITGFGGQEFGTFTGAEIFDTPTTYNIGTTTPTPTPVVTPTPTPVVTPTPTPVVTPTPTPIPGAKDTTTTLSVIHVPLPFGLGGFAIPIANESPVNAAGTVQFKDNGNDIGGPAPVFGGTAVGPFAFLPPGQHSVTAVFTPTDPTVFKPSTSNTVKFRFGGDR
ncbi:MAG: Ig-like domain-containing protein [Pseudonocardiaceae bacterium]